MKNNHYEDDESKALWDWAQYNKVLREYLHHVPNGGKRNAREAARMKAMGVRKGVHDYHLPVPRGGFHGLWIELKATPPNHARTTPEQKEWESKMRSQGYAAFVCRGWITAKQVIEWYLSLYEPGHCKCPELKEVLGR